MQFLCLSNRIHSAAHDGDDAVIVSRRDRDVKSGKAFRWRPQYRITLAENHIASLLHLLICEESVKTIRAVPEVHDQELSSPFGLIMSIMLHRYVDHMTHVTKRLGSCHTVRVASGLVMNLARRFQCSR